MKRTIWIAHTKRKIHATWYVECKQPFVKWKAGIQKLYPNANIEHWYFDMGFSSGNIARYKERL